MDIQLNLINRSNDANNAQIVIFQKNVAADFDEWLIAWQVIDQLGQGDHYPFVYPMEMILAANDSWGNTTPEVTAEDGQLFGVVRTGAGDAIQLQGPATSALEVQCRNDLVQGAVNVNLYKSGRLLMTRTGLAPGQVAAFRVAPTLFIAAMAQMQAGQVMDSAILSSVATELSLLGIQRADIVMTGGGPQKAPYVFTLDNVAMA